MLESSKKVTLFTNIIENNGKCIFDLANAVSELVSLGQRVSYTKIDGIINSVQNGVDALINNLISFDKVVISEAETCANSNAMEGEIRNKMREIASTGLPAQYDYIPLASEVGTEQYDPQRDGSELSALLDEISAVRQRGIEQMAEYVQQYGTEDIKPMLLKQCKEYESASNAFARSMQAHIELGEELNIAIAKMFNSLDETAGSYKTEEASHIGSIDEIDA